MGSPTLYNQCGRAPLGKYSGFPLYLAIELIHWPVCHDAGLYSDFLLYLTFKLI